jgi:hypothetical protein
MLNKELHLFPMLNKEFSKPLADSLRNKWQAAASFIVTTAGIRKF